MSSEQQRQSVFDAQRKSFEVATSAGSIDDGRRAISAYLLQVYDARLPDDVAVEPVDANGVSCTWLRPPQGRGDRVILYLHGGGYMMGSLEESAEMVGRVARQSHATVLAVNYRLAPEHPFPAALDDAIGAYRWLLARGQNAQQVVVLGDSAGGGLALALMVRARDEETPLPAGGVLLSAFVDLTATGSTFESNAESDPVVTRGLVEFTAQAYLQDGDRKNPLASPLYADLDGLSPLLIQVGGAEALLDDSRRLAGRAREQGVAVTLEVWEDMLHTWQFYAWLPEAQQAAARIAEFVTERTHRDAHV